MDLRCLGGWSLPNFNTYTVRRIYVFSGEEFRSWYPPAMLKKETLPSPRTAIRRVEAERRKREARLALANFFLEDQTGGR